MTTRTDSERCRAPIFILGTMRSGTTLLRLILDRHPHIAVGPESGFMRAVQGIKKVPDWYFGDRWYQRYDLDEESMNRRIRRFYGAIFERYAARRGKRRWGEKTPFHRLAMEEMAEIFPRALFMVMVRHAGAVATSLKGWKYPVAESLEDWVRSNREMRRVTRLLDPERVMWCRYEDLVARPEETTRAVMGFLDEPWSQELLRPGEPGADEEAVMEGGTRRDDPIDPEPIDRWREAISPEEMALVRRLAGEALGELGYRVETAVPCRQLGEEASGIVEPPRAELGPEDTIELSRGARRAAEGRLGPEIDRLEQRPAALAEAESPDGRGATWRSRDPVRLLILGRPRSGTTLLANLLNSHDRVTVLSDFLSAPLIQAQVLGGFRRPLSARERNVALSRFKYDLRLSSQRLAIKPHEFSTLDELYLAALRAISDPGDRIVGHKVTGSDGVLPMLLAETDVRCVYMVRDVRDAALSNLHHADDSHLPAGLYVMAWKRAVRLLRSLGSHPRLVVLRYEDMVRDPQEALTPVGRLLDKKIETSFTQLEYHSAPWLENSAFHDVERLFDPRPAGRWTEHLQEPVVRYAAWTCEEEIRELGYPSRPAIAWSLPERLAFGTRNAALRLLGMLDRLRKRARRWIGGASGRRPAGG